MTLETQKIYKHLNSVYKLLKSNNNSYLSVVLLSKDVDIDTTTKIKQILANDTYINVSVFKLLDEIKSYALNLENQ